MNEKEVREFIKKLVLDEINKLECIEKQNKTQENQNDKTTKQEGEIPSLMINGHIIKYKPDNKTYIVISQEESKVGIMCGNDESPWSDGKLFGCKKK